MPESFDGKLVVAISSRALCDLEESKRMFDDQQVDCESASMHVATGHVPFGVANQK